MYCRVYDTARKVDKCLNPKTVINLKIQNNLKSYLTAYEQFFQKFYRNEKGWK